MVTSKRESLLIVFLLLSLFMTVLTCAPKPLPAQPAGEGEISSAPLITPIEEPWERNWRQVLQGALREGSVVVYTAMSPDIRSALAKAFMERYKINVEYLTARGPELSAKIIAEQRANLYIPDVLIGAGLPAIAQLKPAGVFDRLEPVLILKDVIDPSYWFDNSLPWVDREHYVLAFLLYASVPIIINAKLTGPDEIRSYNDLLSAKWKKKMIMHSPAVAGSGNAGVWGLRTIMGEGFLRELAKQEPFILENDRQIAEWLARGKYGLGLFIKSDLIVEFQRAGAPLQFVTPKEGGKLSVGTGYLSLPKKAPHPNASKVFINWLLSKEGQTAYVKVSELQSAREDVPAEFTAPAHRRLPGIKYYTFHSEEELMAGEKRYRFAMDIFGPLIK